MRATKEKGAACAAAGGAQSAECRRKKERKIMENRTASKIKTAGTEASPASGATHATSSASGEMLVSNTVKGETPDCCCQHRTKERTPEEYKDLINRLSRIEGQIRGLKRMVEAGAYCPDILTQSAAAGSALNSFNRVLMANHIRTCVADDIREGNDETIDELLKTLQKLMK
ncbi:metal-sensing transcriptional repressor [Hornefia butyriciproducens]|uniref:metal-sensing transcriptional repressor n=1 Tax=Hornefia butyriciproducens TaxID=2652293 RepID=UPI003F8CE441